MALDTHAVVEIARLARIRLAEQEITPLVAELSQILEWVAQLAEVDTEGVAPMTSAAAIHLPTRQDAVSDGNRRDAILANAPEAAKGFFAVPKVVE